jgi:glutamyl-tRNA synthetase
MDLYYKYARSFAEAGDIYVCSCSQETFKKIADSQQDCPCRKLTPAQSIIRFESMFEKSKSAEGDFVLRWKANMKDPNPAMRDFPLMRINDTPHPRTKDKYRVWPLMNMSVFVDDVEMGMTHIIRGKDHMDNAKRQNMMYKALGKVAPVTLFVGMYDIVGLELSKSKTKELIEQGVYSGWEDIRIPYLRPMRRRGYQAQAFVNYGIEVGISQVDKTISAEDFFGKLNSLNKEIIDPIANRYSLIQDPVELKIRNVGEQSIMLDLHPKARGSGGRPFKVNGSVLIEKIDFDLTSEGSYIRLMDYCNIRRIGDSWEYVSESYEDYKSLPADNKIIIHWLPADQTQLTTVHVLLADGSQLLASAEKNIERTVVGDIVQFERFGFCRLDSINETTGVRQFWYAHR